MYCVLNLLCSSLSASTTDQNDVRKPAIRSASVAVGNAGLNLNSLTSSQDSGTKQQLQTSQTPSGQTFTRVSDYSSLTQPQNAIYTQQPSSPAGGYYFSVNPQGVQPSAALGPGKYIITKI